MLISAGGGHRAVSGAVRLAWINLLSCGFLVIVIEDLALAKANVGSIPAAGITDGQSVVTAGRQFEFNPSRKVRILLGRKNRAALFRPALDRPGNNFIFIGRSGPTIEVAAIKYRLKTVASMTGENAVRFF